MRSNNNSTRIWLHIPYSFFMTQKSKSFVTLKLNFKKHPSILCLHLHSQTQNNKKEETTLFGFEFLSFRVCLFVWFILYKFLHCFALFIFSSLRFSQKAHDIKLKYKPLCLSIRQIDVTHYRALCNEVNNTFYCLTSLVQRTTHTHTCSH